MNIQDYSISPDTPVRTAIEKINQLGKKVVMITDEGNHLLGIFSDGDMRRYILKNGDLSLSVGNAMNKSPVVFNKKEDVQKFIKSNNMVVYPIVDSEKRLIDIIFWNDKGIEHQIEKIPEDIPVVIMAGGKGTRLYPYTKILPKPLIPIGDYTISERIINKFLPYGCKDFYFVLNYKANMIKAYFNDIDKNYNTYYVDEKEYLGTGGGLSLLKGKINKTFFVSNCDIIVDDNYYRIYNYHKEHKNKITFVCAMKQIIIPYGVITINNDGSIKEMSEKPSFSFLTNTGLYILEPDVIDNINDNEFIHLPDIAKKYMDNGDNVGVYPVSETSWMDMGQFKEMENMINVFEAKK